MRRSLLWAVAIALVVPGCLERETGPVLEAQQAHGSAEAVVGASKSSLQPLAGRGETRFAAAPDQGELVAYPRGSAARRDGAYTWYRADVSEAAAFRAVLEGRLVLTSPHGDLLAFRYEKHLEHPSGDWTWVGRLEGGSPLDEIVITFGKRAVFGSIAQRGRPPLRLTIRQGASWLVESDPSLIRQIDNEATRPKRRDYKIPPRIALDAEDVEQAAAMMASAHAASATGETVVDLVIGYTSGFAASLGGASQAVSRLNYLVDIANQGYTNSQVSLRVRLVKALQVSYPDNTSNDKALEELTGFEAPSMQTTPSPAFSALRAARDQYGADLVSLVRRFYTPENDGCGIAWLIGGEQTPITAGNEFFGYSVVSDGQDADTDGKTYFCRDDTLAHEIGHNMGSQHDRDTAQGDNGALEADEYGRYAYSFGHKTDSTAGNFFTVMAYGDRGQTSYRVYSNPSVSSCGGRPCGVANLADNARSLRQTMSTIANFRPTKVTDRLVRTPSDVNGDGRSDLLWRYTPGGNFQYWLMNGAARTSYANVAQSSAFEHLANGDFDGDGRDDIAWRGTDNRISIWMKSTSGYQTYSISGLNRDWVMLDAADINGDGKSDLIWRYVPGGNVQYWLMNGATRTSYRNLAQSAAYEFLAAGDFNGDGLADLSWRKADNRVAIWTGNGATFQESSINGLSRDWIALDSVDVNGDGKSDLVWRYKPGGNVQYWLMNGAVRASYRNLSASTAYSFVAAGDFNGDGLGDLAWRKGDNRIAIWTGDGVTFREASISGLSTSWVPMNQGE